MNSCPDYRKFRLSKLNQPEYRHIGLLLYWPIYGLMFLYFERIRDLLFECTYHPVYSVLDNFIPFVPQFIIPYFFWFVYLIGMLLYSFFCDIPAFKKYMWYIIITYSITSLIYFIYPTSQELRPVLTGNGIFEKIVGGLYVFDTNTNVCPSIHVLGSLAVCFSAWTCKRFNKMWIKISFFLVAMLISFSTVFLKQHSIIDIITAFILGAICYPLVFCNNRISRFLLKL